MKTKIFFILFLFFTELCFSQSFVINTSRGPQTVSVPEGYTLEESFLEMASLYLEERFAHEETIKIVDGLNFEIEIYLDHINILNQEIDKFQELTQKYMDYLDLGRVSLLLGWGVNLQGEQYIDFSFGGLFLGDYLIYTSVQYPLTFGLSVGRVF